MSGEDGLQARKHVSRFKKIRDNNTCDYRYASDEELPRVV